jgi:hypothetical protein
MSGSRGAGLFLFFLKSLIASYALVLFLITKLFNVTKEYAITIVYSLVIHFESNNQLGM